MTADASSYPATYRYQGGWLWFCILVFSAMTAGGAAGLLYTLIFDHSSTDWQKAVFGAFCVADAVGGPVLLIGLVRWRLVLYRDAIEDRGAFRTRRLLRTEIAGKMMLFTGCPTIILYPKARRQKKIMFGIVFPEDAIFKDWMSTVPQIDPAFFRDRWRRRLRIVRARSE